MARRRRLLNVAGGRQRSPRDVLNDGRTMTSTVQQLDLSGRRAMVVGVETAHGAEIARAYAAAGADVALCVPRPDEGVVTAKRLQREIEALGRDSRVYVMDVMLGKNVQVTTRQVTKELGGLDIVASCPELFIERPIGQTTDVELQQLMMVNFNAQFFVVRAASGEMLKGERGGHIVLLMSTVSERGGLPGAAAYAAGQAATRSLVRSAAQELDPSRVSVSGIALDRSDAGGDDAGRASRAQEAGALAVRLASGGAGYESGEIVAVPAGASD